MTDQTDRLRVVLQVDGTADAAKKVDDFSEKLATVGEKADKAGKGVKDATKEVDAVGGAANTAAPRVGALARELTQGDWRGAALQFARLGTSLGGVGLVANVVTAALALTAVAYYQGSQESTKFNNSLVLTGNYAGLVAGQLDEMSSRVSRATNSTVGGARETLQALVSTGKFTGDTLTAAGRAIELVAHYSGRTRAEVVRDFARMSDGVTKWAVDQNEQYHFLSLAQYEHIKLLEKQGRASEAANVAMVAMSNSMGGKIEPALGSLERAWNSAGKAASWAWDMMKGLGRQETVEDRLLAAAENVDKARARFSAAARNNDGSALDAALGRKVQEDLKKALSDQSVVQSDARLQRSAAAAKAAAAVEAARAIKAAEDADKPGRRGGAEREDPAIERQRRVLAELRGVSASYEQDVQDRVALLNAGKISVQEYAKAQQDLLAKQPFMRAMAKEQADAARLEADRVKELVRVRDLAIAAASREAVEREREIQALERGNEDLQQSIAVIGLTKGQIDALKAARLDHVIAMKLENLEAQRWFGFSQDALEQRQREINALVRQRDLTKERGAAQDAEDLRKQNETESKRFSDDLRRDVTDSLQRAFESGKSPAAALADTLSSTIKTRVTRALAEAIANPILRPLEQALGGGLGGFGGFFDLFRAGGGPSAASFAGGGEWSGVGLFHGGGIVGSASSSRSANASTFAGAPRMHTGGIAGDEQPIIARKGEGVFTEGQMRALAPAGSNAPQVTVNVQTMPGQTADVRQRQSGGELSIDVIVRQLEEQMAGNISAGTGAIGEAMEGRYNLRTAVT